MVTQNWPKLNRTQTLQGSFCRTVHINRCRKERRQRTDERETTGLCSKQGEMSEGNQDEVKAVWAGWFIPTCNRGSRPTSSGIIEFWLENARIPKNLFSNGWRIHWIVKPSLKASQKRYDWNENLNSTILLLCVFLSSLRRQKEHPKTIILGFTVRQAKRACQTDAG